MRLVLFLVVFLERGHRLFNSFLSLSDSFYLTIPTAFSVKVVDGVVVVVEEVDVLVFSLTFCEELNDLSQLN